MLHGKRLFLPRLLGVANIRRVTESATAPTLDDIRAAASRIAVLAHKTPVLTSAGPGGREPGSSREPALGRGARMVVGVRSLRLFEHLPFHPLLQVAKDVFDLSERGA